LQLIASQKYERYFDADTIDCALTIVIIAEMDDNNEHAISPLLFIFYLDEIGTLCYFAVYRADWAKSVYAITL